MPASRDQIVDTATGHGTNQFILKEIPQDWDARLHIYNLAGSSPFIRSLVDTVPERRTFVFDYLPTGLLQFAQEHVPQSVTKRVLKCALAGIAALHDRNIVHNGNRILLLSKFCAKPWTDVKPNNIMIDVASSEFESKVKKVQLVDLEDSAYLHHPSSAIVGAQVGNITWRSPEAHAMGPVRKPSDMFSFGLVVRGTDNDMTRPRLTRT